MGEFERSETFRLQTDAAPTVKGWFIGLSPELDDVAPAEAIRNGDLREALAAARAFSIGGDRGV